MHFKELDIFLNSHLDVKKYKDYCPNGLQVQGNREISKIITGVTACEALIDEAILQNADAIIVHHGFFWKGEEYSITGMKYNRISKLINSGIHLFAYHLPLDGHKELGNNILLAKKLGLTNIEFFSTGADIDISVIGDCMVNLEQFTRNIHNQLDREPLVIKANNKNNRVAICTGGAQDYIEYAHKSGADTFISGEISERTTHTARELGINYIAAGHHATEIFGVRALGEFLSERFYIKNTFININNPA